MTRGNNSSALSRLSSSRLGRPDRGALIRAPQSPWARPHTAASSGRVQRLPEPAPVARIRARRSCMPQSAVPATPSSADPDAHAPVIQRTLVGQRRHTAHPSRATAAPGDIRRLALRDSDSAARLQSGGPDWPDPESLAGYGAPRRYPPQQRHRHGRGPGRRRSRAGPGHDDADRAAGLSESSEGGRSESVAGSGARGRAGGHGPEGRPSRCWQRWAAPTVQN